MKKNIYARVLCEQPTKQGLQGIMLLYLSWQVS